jgi:hypothetical protein
MMRYVVHDDEGPLRAFRTRAAAVKWMADGMRLVVLPKPPSKAVQVFAVLGHALM